VVLQRSLESATANSPGKPIPRPRPPHDVTDRTVLGSYRVDSPSLVCATSNDVGFGLEVVAFRLVLAAERHRG
jgi:hypothetical protein